MLRKESSVSKISLDTAKKIDYYVYPSVGNAQTVNTIERNIFIQYPNFEKDYNKIKIPHDIH